MRNDVILDNKHLFYVGEKDHSRTFFYSERVGDNRIKLICTYRIKIVILQDKSVFQFL